MTSQRAFTKTGFSHRNLLNLCKSQLVVRSIVELRRARGLVSASLMSRLGSSPHSPTNPKTQPKSDFANANRRPVRDALARWLSWHGSLASPRGISSLCKNRQNRSEQVPPRHRVGTYLAYSSSRRGIAPVSHVMTICNRNKKKLSNKRGNSWCPSQTPQRHFYQLESGGP